MSGAAADERNQDVAHYYQHFERLKGFARRQLQGKARDKVGASDIVQSALFSMVRDIEAANVPLLDLDQEGQPLLMPLLFRYLDRHCDKWNKHFQTLKRGGAEVPLGNSQIAEPATSDDLFDRQLLEQIETFSRDLTEQEQRVFACWMDQQTLSETSRITGLSETRISALRKLIRERLAAAV